MTFIGGRIGEGEKPQREADPCLRRDDDYRGGIGEGEKPQREVDPCFRRDDEGASPKGSRSLLAQG